MGQKDSIQLHAENNGKFSIDSIEDIPGLDKSLSIKKFELARISRENLSLHHSSFEGSPQKHPYDDSMLVLILEPFTDEKKFYEFPLDSIGYVEEIGTIGNEKGKSALKVRLWIKKGSPALLSEPFIVS